MDGFHTNTSNDKFDRPTTLACLTAIRGREHKTTMNNYLDLDRHFGLLTNYTQEELFAPHISSKQLSWETVLQGSFSVVVARANFGKTTELRARSKALRAAGKRTVFVALNKVLGQDDFSEALDADDEQSYKAWQGVPFEELTLFVDSLDEASLSREDGLRVGLRRVVKAVNWPNSNVRWVLSSRPAILTPEVLQMLQEELRTSLYSGDKDTSIKGPPEEADGVAVFSEEGPQDDEATMPVDINSEGANSKVENKPVKPDLLKIYSLLPLDERAASTYLSECLGVSDPKATLRAAHHYGLGGLCEGPGGLDVLVYIDPANKPPNSLTDVFDRMVDGARQQARTDPREGRIGALNPDSLDEAVEKLASASAVCQLPNIELPKHAMRVKDGTLSARLVVASLLSETSLNYLLGTRLFIDSGHHQVKLYPDELLPFLAARRLAKLVHSPEHAIRLLANFAWSSSTGECGVYRAYLPLMGWLATFSAHCRHELLKIDPQAVAFFGDLRNPGVSLAEASKAIEDAMEKFVQGGDTLGRGFLRPTAENYWQAGKSGIESVLLSVFCKHGSDLRVRDALLDIASHAKIANLRDAVLQAHDGDYAKLVLDSSDLHYILELGYKDDADDLCEVLASDALLPEQTVSQLLRRLGWRYLSARDIAIVVAKQFNAGHGGFHLNWALTRVLADAADSRQLYALTSALLLRLVGPNGPKQRGMIRHQADQNFVGLVADLLALVVGRGEAPASRSAKLCLVLSRFVEKNHYGTADFQSLRSALQKNSAVRQLFLRGLISPTDRTSTAIHNAVFVCSHFYRLVPGDDVALGEPGFTGLLDEMRSWPSAAPRPASSHHGYRWELDKASKEQLLSVIEQLRDGTNENALAWVGRWLSRTIQQSHFGECDFSVFLREAGEELSAAVRSGLSILWRRRDPMWSEAEPNTTYGVTIAGLQGLFLELGNGAHLPTLNELEVRRAIRYAQFEINGYPKWFWPLVWIHERIAIEEFIAMLSNVQAGSVSTDKAETLIRYLGEATEVVRKGVATTVWNFLMHRPHIAEYTTEAALKVAASADGVVNQETLAAEAWSRMRAAFEEDDATPNTSTLDIDQQGSDAGRAVEAVAFERQQRKARAVVWGAFWLSQSPDSFEQTWESWRANNPSAADGFMFALAAHLGQERLGMLNQIGAGSSAGLRTLQKLYEWVRSVVPEEGDPLHEDGVVYSLDARDHAQRLRGALVPAIANAKTQEAYDILEQLRREATGMRAQYLRRMQFKMREDQAEKKTLEQRDYPKFESSFTVPISDYMSFASAVYNDLLSIKYQTEQGEFSLRRFFNAVSFGRIESDSDGLALEEDFQALLGSELNHASANRYAVTLEPMLPDSTRRDVLCQFATYRATVELKMSMRWTLGDYLEALEHQLNGQYMQAANSKIGFFIVVLQKPRKWKGPNGKWIGFSALLDVLAQKARELEGRDRTLYLRVIGIDATPREDFRAKRAAPKGALGKSKPSR